MSQRDDQFFSAMITRNRINLPEKHVALIWQQMVCKELLSTEDVPIRIIYPGRTNGDSGPDLRDAVIVNGSDLTKGDIEVHVKSSDWYGHEHHADAEYNSVILHVVMWHDCSSPTLLQNGKLIPVLSLAKALRHQPYLLPYTLPCFQILDHMDRRSLKKVLNTVGEERFRQKAMHFQAQIPRPALRALSSGEAAGRVLFRGMMRALGYARNTKPFEDLADSMPLNLIESKQGLNLKQALLLGTAGLLPSQRIPGKLAEESILSQSEEREIRELEQAWQSSCNKVKTMREHDWNLSHIYPNNSPVRRIVAQSYLLDRYREEGLLPGVLQLVKEVPSPKGHRVLEDGLIVTGDGYWRNHFDFDARSKTKISALLGNSKAGEIAVNVVLPFVFSWGKTFNEPELTERAMELYNSYPKLPEHEITRQMTKQFSLEGHSNLTACQQQGLIHIFRNYCREGRCRQCPLVG
jgi:hypothetical protein